MQASTLVIYRGPALALAFPSRHEGHTDDSVTKNRWYLLQHPLFGFWKHEPSKEQDEYSWTNEDVVVWSQSVTTYTMRPNSTHSYV